MKKKHAFARRKALTWVLTVMMICTGTVFAFAEEQISDQMEVAPAVTAADQNGGDGEDGGDLNNQGGNTGSEGTGDNTSSDPLDGVETSSQTLNSGSEIIFKGKVSYKDNKKPVDNEEFTITLQAKKDGKTTDENAGIKSVKNDHDGNYVFSAIKPEEGTVTYTVSMKPSKAPESSSDYVYDDKTYTFVAKMEKDEKGELAGKITGEKDLKTDSLNFENEYKGTSVFVQLKGKKTLSGRTLAKDEFSFDLYEAGNSNSIADGSAISDTLSTGSNTGTNNSTNTNTNTSKLQSVKNQANGDIIFNSIELKDPKEGQLLIYKIKEDTTTVKSGITYDKTEYTVAVNVTKDTDGTLKAGISSITVGSGTNAKSVNEFSFANAYNTANSGTKDDNSVKKDTYVSPTTTHTSTIPTAGKVKTGDNTPIGLFIALFVAFAAVLGGVVFTLRRRKGDQN